MLPSVNIRPIEPADITGLHESIRAVSVAEGLSHEFSALPDDYIKAIFKDKTLSCLIAETAGKKPGGFILYYAIFDGYAGKNRFYIEDLYVVPEYRRNGIAAALVKSVSDEAERLGYAGLRLCAKADNTAAVELYRKLGFSAFEIPVVFQSNF